MVDQVANALNLKFKADLRRYARQLDIGLDVAKRRIAFEIFERVVAGTPVDTGRAKNSWFIENGAPDLSSEEPEGFYPDDGSNSLARMAGLAPATLETPIWITNNLPYIVPLEFGHSDQAADGWVRHTLADVEQLVKAVTRLR